MLKSPNVFNGWKVPLGHIFFFLFSKNARLRFIAYKLQRYLKFSNTNFGLHFRHVRNTRHGYGEDTSLH